MNMPYAGRDDAMALSFQGKKGYAYIAACAGKTVTHLLCLSQIRLRLVMWAFSDTSKLQPTSPLKLCGMSCTHKRSVVNQLSSNLCECQWFGLTFIGASLFFSRSPFLWRERDATCTLTTPCKLGGWRRETGKHKGAFVVWNICSMNDFICKFSTEFV